MELLKINLVFAGILFTTIGVLILLYIIFVVVFGKKIPN